MSKRLAGRLDFLKGNVGIMLLSSGLWNVATAMTWPFYALYVLELGGSYVDIGVISALGAVIRIAPTLFGGYLADALGRKKILYTMSFLMALTELIYAFAPNYKYVYVAAALGALIEGLRDPAFQSIVADSTTSDNRALSMALWQVGPSLFGLISPYAIGLFIDARGILVAMRYAYMFTFAMATVASYLRYRYVEETLDSVEVVERVPRVAARKIVSDFVETFRDLPRPLWTFLLIDFVFTFAWAMVEPYFVTYAKEAVGLTAAQWGLATMLTMGITIVLKPPLARASDRQGRIKFILPCMLIWPVAFLLFGYSWGFYAIVVARLLLAIADSLGSPAWDALFYDYSPREHRGRFSAIASVSWSLIWGAGNIVGGTLYGRYSKISIFQLSAGLLIVGSIAALLKIKEPERRED